MSSNWVTRPPTSPSVPAMCMSNRCLSPSEHRLPPSQQRHTTQQAVEIRSNAIAMLNNDSLVRCHHRYAPSALFVLPCNHQRLHPSHRPRSYRPASVRITKNEKGILNHQTFPASVPFKLQGSSDVQCLQRLNRRRLLEATVLTRRHCCSVGRSRRVSAAFSSSLLPLLACGFLRLLLDVLLVPR